MIKSSIYLKSFVVILVTSSSCENDMATQKGNVILGHTNLSINYYTGGGEGTIDLKLARSNLEYRLTVEIYTLNKTTTNVKCKDEQI